MSDEPGGAARAATILVVDDEERIRGLMQKVLVAAGYRVLVARDGKEALQQIKGSEVDLVITDLVMPVMEGLEVIRSIRSERPGVKIIAMSGMFEGKFLRPAQLLGAHATLAKPFQPRDLLEAVKRVLAVDGL